MVELKYGPQSVCEAQAEWKCNTNMSGCPYGFTGGCSLGGNTIDNVGATALAQWAKTARCLETLMYVAVPWSTACNLPRMF